MAWVFCFWAVTFPIFARAEAGPRIRSHLFEADPWKRMGQRLVDPSGVAILEMGGLATAISTAGDFPMRDQWGQHQHMDKETAAVGDSLGTGIPGAMVALGQYFFDVENADAHARALVATSLATHAMKAAVGRKRPGTSPDRRSFPSGHTSTTFASATALTEAYGWKAAVVTYPLAVLTGLSRVSDDVHWFSDTVGGAVLGVAMGRAAYLSDENDAAGVSWAPWIDGDTFGFVAECRF